ncbi:hypothetical protein HMPREF3196_01483 [Bifidobacterium bifidum]|uniref:Uncharacterized protein n=1 Tax=Bifidobacterium bifidum TaxID=1681 RepID=A0A133KMM7_BIFBI|nr:hypothetical protein HMPREF3196_01483 [Bifidobacterium bifidum]
MRVLLQFFPAGAAIMATVRPRFRDSGRDATRRTPKGPVKHGIP